MKLLFDQNLSFRMVGLLKDLYPDSAHVRDLILGRASDAEIWRYAADYGFTVTSKDSDFHWMSILYGHPPKVIWLRVGNSPTGVAAALLRENYDIVEQFHTDTEAALLTLG